MKLELQLVVKDHVGAGNEALSSETVASILSC